MNEVHRGLMLSLTVDRSGILFAATWFRPDKALISTLVRKALLIGSRPAIEAARTAFWASYWSATDLGKCAGDTGGKRVVVLTRIQALD